MNGEKTLARDERLKKDERLGKEELLKKEEDEQMRRNFEKKHAVFLEELSRMPKDAKIEKDQGKKKRWDFFDEYDRRDDFMTDLMEVYHPGAYRKLKARLGKGEAWANNTRGNANNDPDIASWQNKRQIDWCLFMNALKKAIESYTGVNKEEKGYDFVICMRKLYRQEAGYEAAANEMAMTGISDTGIPKKNIRKIMKLAKTTKSIWGRNPRAASLEEVLEEQIKESNVSYTKKDMELVRALVFKENIVTSMEEPLITADGSSNDTLGDQLADGKDDYAEVMEQEDKIPFLEAFCQEIEEKWEMVTSARGMKDQELIKIYFTQSLLKCLKLDDNWQPYQKKPAGNKVFYQKVKPKGDFLYGRLFYKKYLRRAFAEKTECFYDVYAWLLRKDFNFSDTLLAELMEKDKTVVSRGKKRYRELLWDMYRYYEDN